ncbi:MAG TPA: CinA family nicotinamide mononucleotide deamidase-related protein, partial [Candidatus Binataceae bacterium]|nr:CinA family nicotinamide mononucleotide deamidase-related protein [Candidatus Binataceae bacterium]
MIKRAVILSTGDEITSGKVVDTNANYLSDKLAENGIDLVAVLTVGDVPERLEWAWRTAIAMADVVISTGGIGPTVDDLTTETIARVARVKLVRDQGSVDLMRRMFSTINRVMPENNLKQADFPEGAEIIPNPLGTAPGFRMPMNHEGHHCELIVLPGVPREMKPMMENWVVPWLQKNRGTDSVFAVRIFQTFGMSESALDEAVAGLIGPGEAKVGLRASFPQISLRLTVEGKPAEAERKLEELAGRVRGKISQFLFAEGDASMEEVVGRLLTEKKLKLAIAESCTGGLIGHRLTNIPGSSNYLL